VIAPKAGKLLRKVCGWLVLSGDRKGPNDPS
jgi:hypothetical protein